MPFGDRQPLIQPDEMPDAASILKQCIMLLRAAGEIGDDETERMIADLGLRET